MTRPVLMLQQLWFLLRIGFALLLLDLACHGASARLSWQAGPESDLDRYEVHWAGDNYEVGSMVVPATDVSAIVSVLTAGVRYEFTLVAVNTAGMKSDPSDPVSWIDQLPSEPVEPEPVLSMTRHTYTMQVGNDLDGWSDISRVVVDNPPPRLFFRIRREIEMIQTDP